MSQNFPRFVINFLDSPLFHLRQLRVYWLHSSHWWVMPYRHIQINQSGAFFFFLVKNLYVDTVLVCKGCHSKVYQPDDLYNTNKQRFRGLEVQEWGVNRVPFFLGLLKSVFMSTELPVVYWQSLVLIGCGNIASDSSLIFTRYSLSLWLSPLCSNFPPFLFFIFF